MNDLDHTGSYRPTTVSEGAANQFSAAETAPPGRDRPAPVDEVAAEQPDRIGRYRVERVLGAGGFGIVYLAHDGQLQRLVAIKVPHHALVARSEAAEAYLTEARTVAKLDHPNI